MKKKNLNNPENKFQKNIQKIFSNTICRFTIFIVLTLKFATKKPNALHDVRSGFEYMIAPSLLDSWATDPQNGKQVGFGWYQWNYNRQRWGILDTQNGKKIPENMKNAIEKYLGFGDDKLEVLETLCPEDAQIGMEQPDDDIPNVYRIPKDKNSGIVTNNDKKFKEKIDKTSLMGDLSKFSQNRPQFENNLRDLHKRVYQPIPIENDQQYKVVLFIFSDFGAETSIFLRSFDFFRCFGFCWVEISDFSSYQC